MRYEFDGRWIWSQAAWRITVRRIRVWKRDVAPFASAASLPLRVVLAAPSFSHEGRINRSDHRRRIGRVTTRIEQVKCVNSRRAQISSASASHFYSKILLSRAIRNLGCSRSRGITLERTVAADLRDYSNCKKFLFRR